MKRGKKEYCVVKTCVNNYYGHCSFGLSPWKDQVACNQKISMEKHLIEKISMSTRLKNILRRSGIEYLEQIQEYPKESIQKFRNMGKETLQELYLLCEQYGIHIYDKSDLEDEEKGISFSPSKYEKLFIKGIRSKEELLKIDIHGLKKQYGLSNNDLEKLRKMKEAVEQRKGISL